MSLVLLAASVVLAVVVGVQHFPHGLTVLACLVVALLAAWWALVHRGAVRFAAAVGAGVLLVGAVVLVVLEGRVLEDVLIIATLVASLAAARRVFAVHVTLPVPPPPKRPVLFYNPKSGGGKAERFEVAREARARGVEPVELHLGDDLATLVRDAIANGAALRRVLRMRDEVRRAAVLVADHLGADMRPDDRAVLAHVALVALEAVDRPADRGRDERRVVGKVLTMGDVTVRPPEQLGSVIPEHATVRVVDLQPPAVELGDRHPARRTVKRRTQHILRPIRSLLG